MSRWSHYSTPDKEFLEVLSLTPPAQPTQVEEVTNEEPEIIRLQRLRAEVSRKRVEAAGPPIGVTVEEKRIPVKHPPGEISIRVYTPESQDESETFPGLVHMHSGGYCLGTLDNDELLCRTNCETHRIVVINVDYRLAPQYPWPTGPEDSYETVKWVAANALAIRIELKKGFIIGGLSAGANFACVITQRAREDPELKGKITGQILQCPPTITRSSGYPEKFKPVLLSYEANKNDPILTRKNILMFMDAYKPGNQYDPIASPLLADSLAGLPPAYIQVAGADPLRDEGLVYTQEMEACGVKTRLDVYPGLPHAFVLYFPQLSASAKWRADLVAGIQWLLSFTKS